MLQMLLMRKDVLLTRTVHQKTVGLAYLEIIIDVQPACLDFTISLANVSNVISLAEIVS